MSQSATVCCIDVRRLMSSRQRADRGRPGAAAESEAVAAGPAANAAALSGAPHRWRQRLWPSSGAGHRADRCSVASMQSFFWMLRTASIADALHMAHPEQVRRMRP